MKVHLFLPALILVTVTSCTRTPQQNAETFLKHGKQYMAAGDFSRAALDFRNAAHLQPKSAEPVFQLGLAESNRGDLNLAIADIVRATRLDPHHTGARVKLAELMARSGDPKLVRDAESRMLDLVAVSPENIDALNAAALAEIALGRLEDAETHLREALGRVPHNVNSDIEIASYYLKREDPQHAEAALRDAQTAAPKSAAAARALADFYILSRRNEDAEKWLGTAAALSPGDADVLLRLASVESSLGKRDRAEALYKKLAGLPDKRHATVYAACLFFEGRRDDAVREFQKLAREMPKDRAVRTQLVAADLATGRSKEAISVLDAALKSNPNDSEALLQQSAILIHSGDCKAAEADLNRLIHFAPDSAEAHYLLARIYGVWGDPRRENSELTEAIHLNASFWPAREALADLFVRSHSPNAAMDLLSAAPEAQKRSLPFLLARNLATYAGGDSKGFQEGVAEALKIGQSPEALLQDAVVKLNSRDYPGARASLEMALRQRPDDIRLIRTALFSYAAQKDVQGAREFLEFRIGHSRSASVQELAAEWLWSIGDRSGARAALARARSIDPNYHPADLAAARAYIVDGNPTEAQELLRRVIAADDGNFSAHMLLASLQTRDENYKAAVEQYRKVLDAQPRNAQALNNLAYLLADKLNDSDTALPYAQKAVEVAPDNSDATGTLGWVMYRKGLYAQSEQILKRAVTLDRGSAQPNAVIRMYHLAMSYQQAGDKNLAKETFTKALVQNPNLPDAKAAGAVLQ